MNYAIYEKKSEYAKNLKSKLLEKLENHKLDYDHPEVVIIIGGDGTFLRTVKKYINRLDEVKFLVFKAGNLSHYAEFDETDVDKILEIFNFTNYISFDLLEFTINNLNDEKYYAINELSIYNYQLLSKLQIYVDDLSFEEFNGNGLCISTSHGSTGLNKSLNGSIIDWDLKTIQITEIAGVESKIYHSLQNPLVLSGNRTIKIVNKNYRSKQKFLTYDYENRLIKEFNQINIKLSDKKIKCFTKQNNLLFYKKIKQSFDLKD